MTSTATAKALLLRMIQEYGDARARVPNQANRELAAEWLHRIDTALGPAVDPTELRDLYLAGHSLTVIARRTGLSYGLVRSTIINTGTPMRPQGRHPRA